ncbi:MAG: GGDEF domain-containing protein [Clostridia bacterium]
MCAEPQSGPAIVAQGEIRELRTQVADLNHQIADYKEKIADFKEKMAACAELKKTQEALLISERRHEIVMKFADATVFEYDVRTKRILTQPQDFEEYGMPAVMENGVEGVLRQNQNITQESVPLLRELYRQIDEGAPQATATIWARNADGLTHTLSLQMVNIFGPAGKPIYAVGIRKDITNLVEFHKEKEYGALLASERAFIYEADFTLDTLLRYDATWVKLSGIDEPTTLSSVLKATAERYIAPEHKHLFLEKQSSPFVLDAFERGERIVTFEYRKLVPGKGYLWYEMHISMIADELTHHIHMRAYTLDISGKKTREVKAVAEHNRYESMVAKSVAVYEMNLTQNQMILGQDTFKETHGFELADHAADTALARVLPSIHPHDRAMFSAFMQCKPLLEAYRAGRTEFTCVYRRIDASEKYHWYRYSLKLFEDPGTENVLCYAYIEDIHAEKEKELHLLYNAEHDLMTGFYNKSTTAEKVDLLLSSESGMLGQHLFFIIDLDYFKLINDKFGHAFGDVVLSQTASRISALFREGDILGRIGGDEFVVLMKNVQSLKMASLKAQEICASISEIYTQQQLEHKITSSIGIAVYPAHGRTYDALYRHSDAALYQAKEQGRNRFALYQMDTPMDRSAVKEMDLRLIPEEHPFAYDLNTYAFRILYEARDKRLAINSVLELVGKRYHLSRAYILELSKDARFLTNTFEWCREGISSQMAHMQHVPCELLAEGLNAEGVFYMPDAQCTHGALKEMLLAQGVQSMLQFQLLKNGAPAGFIGFDECTRLRTPEEHELLDYRNFTNTLGVFLTEMRALEAVETARNMALSVVNGLDAYAYVCDPATHRLLFINDKTLREFAPDAQVGDLCYQAIWHGSTPCPGCPMQALCESCKNRYADLRYNPRLGVWVKVTTTWINWSQDRQVCLIDVRDISEFHAVTEAEAANPDATKRHIAKPDGAPDAK